MKTEKQAPNSGQPLQQSYWELKHTRRKRRKRAEPATTLLASLTRVALSNAMKLVLFALAMICHIGKASLVPCLVKQQTCTCQEYIDEADNNPASYSNSRPWLNFQDTSSLVNIAHVSGSTNAITTDLSCALRSSFSSCVSSSYPNWCDNVRVFTLVDIPPTNEVTITLDAATGHVTTQLMAGQNDAKTHTFTINVQFMEGGNAIGSARVGIFKIVATLCVSTNDNGWTYPAPNDVFIKQIRTDAKIIAFATRSYSGPCDGILGQSFVFTNPATGLGISLPDGVVDNGNFSLTLTPTAVSPFKFLVYYTESNQSGQATHLRVNSNKSILIEFTDTCDQATITPFTVSKMVTSVLRPTTKYCPGCGGTQNFPDLVQLISSDAVVNLNVDGWNVNTCNDLEVIVEHFGRSEDFVTVSYAYQLTRQITLAPTINDHIEDNYNVGLRIQLKDYTTVFNVVSLLIEVEKCEILTLTTVTLDKFPTVGSAYTYDMLVQDAVEVEMRDYQFSPACNYDEAWSIAYTPAIVGPQTIFFNQPADSSILTIDTIELNNRGTYSFTQTLTLSNFPYGTGIYERTYTINLSDRCNEEAVLTPSIDTIAMYSIIGKPNKSVVFQDYNDTISVEYDPTDVQDISEFDIGYITCGLRIHELREEFQDGTFSTHEHVEKFARISKINPNRLKVTYGTNSNQFVGFHEIELKVIMENYTHTVSDTIPTKNDSSARLNITFFQQLTDLFIPEYKYFVAQEDPQPIQIPQLQFYPELHESLNEITGENGAVIIQTIQVLLDDAYRDVPADLGTLNEAGDLLIIDSYNAKYIGNKKFKVTYKMQDYLKGQFFESDFSVLVYPELTSEFQIPIRPIFNLEEVETQFDILLKQSWDFDFPDTFHTLNLEVTYMKPDLGSASTFVDWDEASHLSIKNDTTTNLELGTHVINLFCIDELRIESMALPITINIIAEEETAENDVNLGDFVFKNDQVVDVGSFYASLLAVRQKPQVLYIDDNNKPIPPKVKISQINKQGRVKVQFSNKMIVNPALLTLNQDGILIRRRGRMLNETVESEPERLDIDIIEVKSIPGGYSNEEDLKFTWNVTDFKNNSQEMYIQLYFKNPLSISTSGEQDEIQIIFKSEELFYDENYLSLQNNTSIIKVLPQQDALIAGQENLETAANSLKSGTQLILSSQFILKLVLMGSLQQLWDMINAQQIVILLALFKVTIPPTAGILFNVLFQIAAFELIPTDVVYFELFGSDPDDGRPLTPNFEEIGFEHHLLLDNFGTLGVFVAMLPLPYVFYYIISWINGIKCCRKLTKTVQRQIFWGVILRMIIESYIIGLICCLLNLRELDFSNDDTWVFVNSILTCFLTPILCVFPLYGLFFLVCRFNQLHTRTLKLKFGELYEGYDTSSKGFIIYWGIDQARKILIVCSVCIWKDHLWLQLMILTYSSTILIITSGYVKYRKTKYDQKMDMFNEAKLILIMDHMILFTPFVPDINTKLNMGYSCFAVVSIGLIINISSLAVQPIKLCRRKSKIRYYQKKAKKQIKIDKPRFQSKRFKERRDNLEVKQRAKVKRLLEMAIEFKKDQDHELSKLQAQEVLRQIHGCSAEEMARRQHNKRSVYSDMPDFISKAQKRRNRILKKQRPLIMDKLRENDDVNNSNNVNEIEEELPVSTVINTVVDPDIGFNMLPTIQEEPLEISQSIDNDLQLNYQDQIVQQQQYYQGRPKLSYADLEYLWAQHQIPIAEVEKLPGFENFILVDDGHHISTLNLAVREAQHEQQLKEEEQQREIHEYLQYCANKNFREINHSSENQLVYDDEFATNQSNNIRRVTRFDGVTDQANRLINPSMHQHDLRMQSNNHQIRQDRRRVHPIDFSQFNNEQAIFDQHEQEDSRGYSEFATREDNLTRYDTDHRLIKPMPQQREQPIYNHRNTRDLLIFDDSSYHGPILQKQPKSKNKIIVDFAHF